MTRLRKVKVEVVGVNAFFGGGGQGNLAGVCVLREPLREAEMQAIAKNFGASETAFVVLDEGVPLLRWFTPTQEIALCGHGTLATAYVLWERGLVNSAESISFRTQSGILNCFLNSDKRIEMKFPELLIEPAHVSPTTLHALGIRKPLFVALSEKYLLVEIESVEMLKNLNPDFEALKKVGQRGFLITTQGSGSPYDFVSRCFFPKEGIPEDPVTGSAHCVLGPYWRRKLAKSELLAYQASKSGGELGMSFEPKTVVLKGCAQYSNL